MAGIMSLKAISPRVLYQLLQNTSVTAIDVNPSQSWTKARVPGARNLDPVAYSDTALPPNKDSLLVFYYSNFLCSKAPNAARRAKSMAAAACTSCRLGSAAGSTRNFQRNAAGAINNVTAIQAKGMMFPRKGLQAIQT